VTEQRHPGPGRWALTFASLAAGFGAWAVLLALAGLDTGVGPGLLKLSRAAR